MTGDREQMNVPKRLDITTGQLETAIGIFEALANRQLYQKHLPNVAIAEPKVYSLFISDLIVKAKSTDMYYIESGKDNGFTVGAGEFFTILNQTQSRVRLSFFDDTLYTMSAMTTQHLQLPTEDGIPVLILEPGTEGAVTTLVINGGGLNSVWINIEKQKDNGEWKPVGPGGNGANMRIDDP